MNKKHIKRAMDGLHFYTLGSLRKLYDWVIKWAYTKYGTSALFILAFAESSFFPIPPDVLLIALGVSRPRKSFIYATVCTIGSIIGALFGYLIGYLFFTSIGQVLINSFGYQHMFETVGKYYANNAFLAILTAGVTPIPFKVFTLAAGFWSISIKTFIIAVIIARASRFFAVSTLLYIFGAKTKAIIDKYFDLATIIFILLLIAGFMIIKLML